MELTCLNEKLREGIALVQKAVGKNTTLPILTNILFSAEKNHLTLRSTNLEVGVSISIPSKITQEGSVAVPADVLSNFFTHNNSQESIKLTKNNDALTLETPNNKTIITVMSSEEFPKEPIKNKKESITLNHNSIQNALMKTMFATSASDTRPELTGVYIVFDQKAVRFVATDSFRLVEYKLIFEECPQNYAHYEDVVSSIILPKNTCVELLHIISVMQKPITLTIEDNQIFFEIGECTLISQIIDGTYPDYEQIMPVNHKTTLTVNKKELSSAIKTSAVFTNTQNAEIAIEIVNGKSTVQSRTTQQGAHTSVVESVVDGDDQSIALNPRYVLDGINACEGDEVIFLFNSAQSPVLIAPKEDVFTHTYKYVVMPVKSA